MDNGQGADFIDLECGAKVIGRDVEYGIEFEAGGSIIDKDVNVINVERIADLFRGERGGEVQLDDSQHSAVASAEIGGSVFRG